MSTSNLITFTAKNLHSWKQIWIQIFCGIQQNKFFLQRFKKLKFSLFFSCWDKIKSPENRKYFTCTFYICREPHLSIPVKLWLGQQQRVLAVSSAVLHDNENVSIGWNQLCIFRQNSVNVKLKQQVLTSEIKTNKQTKAPGIEKAEWGRGAVGSGHRLPEFKSQFATQKSCDPEQGISC